MLAHTRTKHGDVHNNMYTTMKLLIVALHLSLTARCNDTMTATVHSASAQPLAHMPKACSELHNTLLLHSADCQGIRA